MLRSRSVKTRSQHIAFLVIRARDIQRAASEKIPGERLTRRRENVVVRRRLRRALTVYRY
jgi:hypothetical protein